MKFHFVGNNRYPEFDIRNEDGVLVGRLVTVDGRGDDIRRLVAEIDELQADTFSQKMNVLVAENAQLREQLEHAHRRQELRQ